MLEAKSLFIKKFTSNGDLYQPDFSSSLSYCSCRIIKITVISQEEER